MPQINKLMFREYDIRGEIDKDLTNESIELIGKGFGTFLLNKNIKSTILAFDAREYSERIKNMFLQGLLSTGVNALEIGMVITPIAYFAQYHFKTKGLAMITASHNPNGWSGFKLGYDYAKTLLPEDINVLYNIIAQKKFIKGRGKTIQEKDIINAYKEFILSKIKISRSLKVVINAGNGTAGPIVPDIIRKAGCEVVEQFCNLDFTFPNHEPNPSAMEAIEALAKKVKEANADLGLGFDGDGDRLGTADEKGNIVWPDKVIILLSRLILKKNPGAKIVFDVKCSQALPEDIKAHGGVPFMWKTGHSYIKQKTQELDAALGGERSGHIFYTQDYFPYDDAVFAGLKLLEYLSLEKLPFSEILKTTPQYVTSPTYHADCADDIKYKIVDKLIKEFKKDYGKRVIDINGARVKFPKGWGLVRASSNLPVLVMVFEGKIQRDMEEIMDIFKKKMSKYSKIGKKWYSG